MADKSKSIDTESLHTEPLAPAEALGAILDANQLGSPERAHELSMVLARNNYRLIAARVAQRLREEEQAVPRAA